MGRELQEANTEQRASARLRALQLRLEGWRPSEIAPRIQNELQIRYTPRMAQNDISSELAIIEKEQRETAAELAWIELDRFDALLKPVWSKAMDGDLAAVSKVLEISRERRKLAGIDKDTLKVDWRIELFQLMEMGKLKPEEIVDEFGEEVLEEINRMRDEE